MKKAHEYEMKLFKKKAEEEAISYIKKSSKQIDEAVTREY